MTIDRFIELSKTSPRITVFQELAADRITPISVFEALGTETKDGAILESGSVDGINGRYSFICLHPITTVTATDNQNPLQELRNQLAQQHCHTEHPLTHLVGGAVGFITYDAVRLFEDIPNSQPDKNQLPDIMFKFYRTNIAFDHQARKVVVSMLAKADKDPEQAYTQAMHKIDRLIKKISSKNSGIKTKQPQHSNNIEISIDDENFRKVVTKAKEYILMVMSFSCFIAQLS